MKIPCLLYCLLSLVGIDGARVTAPWLGYCNQNELETREFLYNLSPQRFWNSLSAAKKMELDLVEDKLLKLALKFRLYSPRIAIAESLFPPQAPDCEIFVQAEGSFYCNVDNFKEKIKNKFNKIDNLDQEGQKSENEFGLRVATGKKIIYLYSSATATSKLSEFKSILQPLIDSGDFSVIFRHIVKRDCALEGTTRNANGFGLELEIKDYGKEDGKVRNTPIGNVVFHQPPKSPNHYEHLGSQLVQSVLEAGNPLEALNFVSENMPLIVGQIVHRTSIKPEISAKVNSLATHFNLAETMISINGVEVIQSKFNILSIIEFMINYKSLLLKHLDIFNSNQQVKLGKMIMKEMFSTHPTRFDVRSEAAIALNDLEKETRYRIWPRTYNSLLRPPMGQFYPLARNAAVATFYLDINQLSKQFVLTIAQMTIQLIPIQFSLVVFSRSESLDDLALLYAIHKYHGTAQLLEFLMEYLEEREKEGGSTSNMVNVYNEGSPKISAEDLIVKMGSKDFAENAVADANRLGISKNVFFVNGKLINFSETNWQRELMRAYQEEIYQLQVKLVEGEINDSFENFESLMIDPETFKSRHEVIFSSQSSIPTYSTLERNRNEKNLIFNQAKENSPVVVEVFADLRRKKDFALLKQWLEYLRSTPEHIQLKIKAIYATKTQDNQFKDLLSGRVDINTVIEKLSEIEPEEGQDYSLIYGGWDQKRVDISKGPMVALNSHLYGPFNEDHLLSLDISSWLRYERQKAGAKMFKILQTANLPSTFDSVASLCSFDGHLRKLLVEKYHHIMVASNSMEITLDKVNHFTVNQNKETTLMGLQILINPFSHQSANVASILLELGDLISASVIINVLPKYLNNPVKDVLYRFRHFNGTLGKMLPEGMKYALMINAPIAWDYVETSADSELDNLIYYEKNSRVLDPPTIQLLGLNAEVEARVGGNGGVSLPGIPLRLVKDKKIMSKSTTFSGLGYAQLKSLPGIYNVDIPDNDLLRLAPTQIYLDSMASNSLILPVIADIASLRKVNLSTLFLPKKSDQTIHVFTIVSGLIYERLARTMIFSVLKKTKSTVKFWIIGNYVSAGFEDNLKRLSSHLRFDYELIRFRWPSWLTPQWRKHRKVWAQKILFLDLFPSTITRLIYIDADQIMRADIKELAEIDLEGRVYGFVPFCESRKETAHLRFWSSGYWADHLRGLPYHISALFVVDMVMFRDYAVGDRLRLQYQMLSQDPNSLANLDQDLPNNLQHEVPIYSLPSEWLWCETWCDNGSKQSAKSIDLCSNPLKREDKLEQAKRIIPEWKSYEQQIIHLLATEDEDLFDDSSLSSDHEEL